jgi:hypothetical protein
MNTSTTINPAEFTQEQKQYLQGFFAGIAQRAPVPFVGHAQNGLITNDPASGLPNQAAVDTKPGATPPSPISQGKSAGSTSRIRSPSGTRSFSTATRISHRPKTTASVSSTSASSTSLPHKTLSCSAFASPAAFLLRINYADLHNSPKTTAVAAPISRRGAISSSASFSPATSSASSSASSPSASPLAAPAPTTSAISPPRPSPASTPANSSM